MFLPIGQREAISEIEVLRQHGRSFNFARYFLNRKYGNRAARLYAYCRQIDDTADEAQEISQAREALLNLQHELLGKRSARPLTANFLSLTDDTGLDLGAAASLIDGVASDLDQVAIKTEGDLIRYAYQVAGTVGIMMCHILDVDDAKAEPFAIDLGIAMQLTNIARDVLEDARSGRRYIPGTWVEHVTADQIASLDNLAIKHVGIAVARLLKLAEDYYKSAHMGFVYLPLRARLAIHIATRIYQHIGSKICKQNYNIWDDRVIVTTSEKMIVALQAICEFVVDNFAMAEDPEHDLHLHSALMGLMRSEEPPN